MEVDRHRCSGDMPARRVDKEVGRKGRLREAVVLRAPESSWIPIVRDAVILQSEKR